VAAAEGHTWCSGQGKWLRRSTAWLRFLGSLRPTHVAPSFFKESTISAGDLRSRAYKSQSDGKPPQIRLSSSQNMSDSQYFCIYREHLNGGKYAYTSSFVRYGWRKSSNVSKIPPIQAKNQSINVSVFLSTLQLTALLLKNFHIRLHCYTLASAESLVF